MICGCQAVICRAGLSKRGYYGQVFSWLIVGSVPSEGGEMGQADRQMPGAYHRIYGRQERLNGTPGRRER